MQIKHLKKNIHLLYFLLLSITAHSQNQYNVLREEAVHYMNLNDANQAIQSLTKIVQLYEKSPESILDIFLWRAKLHVSTSNFQQAQEDINTYLLYDSSCTEAYLNKVLLIDNLNTKMDIIQLALYKLPNDYELLLQQCILKIGIVSNYWEMQSNNGVEFNMNTAYKEIPTAKNGCNELLQLANNTNEVTQLYKKICKIPDIKSF